MKKSAYFLIVAVAVLVIFAINKQLKIGESGESVGKTKCEWESIEQKYKKVNCSGTIEGEKVKIKLNGVPVEKVKALSAEVVPCEKWESGMLYCSGTPTNCTIESATKNFEFKCPNLGKMVVNVKMGLPTEMKTSCYNPFWGQPAEICWFGTVKLYQF